MQSEEEQLATAGQWRRKLGLVDPKGPDVALRVPASCRREIASWDLPQPDEGVLGIRAFTDSSSELQAAGIGKVAAAAGWSCVLFFLTGTGWRFAGAVWGPVAVGAAPGANSVKSPNR